MQTDSYVASYTMPREKRADHSNTLSPATREALRGAAIGSFVAKQGDCLSFTPSNASAYFLPDLDVVRLGTLLSRDTRLVLFPAPALIGSGAVDLKAVMQRANVSLLTNLTLDDADVVGNVIAIDAPVGNVIAIDAPVGNVIAIDAPAPGASAEVDTAEVTDYSTAAISTRLAELSGLDDGQLARLFKVRRETFQRWRTGVLDNPRPATRRRLGLLLHVFEDLARQVAMPRDWLLNTTVTLGGEGVTPCDLLERGRVDVVTRLLASVNEPMELPSGPSPATEPLQFGDDDVWEFDDEDTDGDG